MIAWSELAEYPQITSRIFPEWLLWQAKGALLLVLAIALSVIILRRSSAATRHLYWTTALVGLLVLLIVFLALPNWDVALITPHTGTIVPVSENGKIGMTDQENHSARPDPMSRGETLDTLANGATAHQPPSQRRAMPESDSMADIAAGAPGATSAVEVAATSGVTGPLEEPRNDGAVHSPPSPGLIGGRPGTTIVGVWIVGIVVFALRLGWTVRRLAALRRKARVVADRGSHNLLKRTAREMGIERDVAFVTLPDRLVPMTWGVFWPVILIPEHALAWPAERLRLVLAHELSHVRRRDALVDLITRIACVVYWVNPLAWWVLSRLRLEREHACDDAVVGLAERTTQYAETLLAVVQGVSFRRFASRGALSIAHSSQIELRLRALLDETRNRRAVTMRSLVAGLAVALAFVVSVGALRPVARAGQAAPQSSPAGDGTILSKAIPTAAAAGVPKDLDELIGKVRESEALFRNLDVKVKTLWKFHPQPSEPQAGFSFGPSVLEATEETHRQVTQGDRSYFSSEDVVALTSGEKLTGIRIAVCDGMQTVAIDEGNSATVFQRRYEPAWVFPPHCWGLFTLEVNFPLSVYLQGTEAMKSHPKVRRYPMERGSVFEFNKVESELIGEEVVEDLSCIKVKVKRWHYTKDAPVIQYLWLAKDRNYHVAQCRTAWTRKGNEVPGDNVRVTKWRRVADGIWLPGVVESQSFVRDANGNETSALLWTRKLTVGPATLNPKVPADLFILPRIPDSLPKFVVGTDGRLEDSPLHPMPAQADAGTTLDTILMRLADEEAKYDRFEVTTIDQDKMLNRSELSRGSVQNMSEGRERSVRAGGRLFYLEEKLATLASGKTTSNLTRQAYDGQWLRGINRYSSGSDKLQVQSYANLSLVGPDDMQLVRAHTTVFRVGRKRQSLCDFLKSGWYDRHNNYKMAVEYLGDDLVGDLHCHKLKCELRIEGLTVPHSYEFLWLARDRNMIPVRKESHDPHRSEKLPTGVCFVDDLREIRPGIWYPYHTAMLAFQGVSREGLSENRPLLQWRHDVRVEALTLDPVVDDALFTRLEVPEGTQIQVRDERGDFIGQFKQPRDGNIDVRPEELRAMRQTAKVSKEEVDRRQIALDALIGLPAPELPRETWLNSPPLSWKDLAGKVVVIDFWATWCGPCESDLKRLAGVHKARQDNGVTDQVILGIHTAGTARDIVAKAAVEKNLSYPVLIDSPPKEDRRAWGDLFDKFAVHQIPITFVVDATGKIIAHGRLEEMLAKASQLADAKKKSEKE